MDARVIEFAAADAKARFSELLDRAEHGEDVMITRHGRPVAKLVPVTVSKVEDARRARKAAWAAYLASDRPTLGPDITIRQLIEEGRKY